MLNWDSASADIQYVIDTPVTKHCYTLNRSKCVLSVPPVLEWYSLTRLAAKDAKYLF